MGVVYRATDRLLQRQVAVKRVLAKTVVTGRQTEVWSHIQTTSLAVAPTRELATQISDDFRAYGKNLHLRQTVIFGGVNQNPQTDNLRRGVDIIIRGAVGGLRGLVWGRREAPLFVLV